MEPHDFRIGPFEFGGNGSGNGIGSGNGSSNGHRRGTRAVFRFAAAAWPVAAGAAAGALIAGAVVPRIHFLNLALFNPWARPVAVAGAAGVVAGLVRRARVRPAAVAGAIAGVIGLWLAYLATRAQLRTLWVERSAARVILADLARLAAYCVIPGALGGALGSRVRSASAKGSSARRERENAPITEL